MGDNNNLSNWNDTLTNAWATYGTLMVVAVGAVSLLALVALLLYAKAGKRPIRPTLIWLGSNLALLLNAEGMWQIATHTLHLPPGFAVLVFAVFEVALTTAMSLASERYRATCRRDETGKLIEPGHPGVMLRVVWVIAILSGAIVASNAPTHTEQILRVALPVIVVLMWWATLTAEGQKPRRGRFAYSPTRLAERWGWVVPDADPDFRAMARERQVRAMVVFGHRVSAGTPGHWYHEWRLVRLARTADESVVVAVTDQLARTAGVVARIQQAVTPAELPAPLNIEVPAELPVAAKAEVPGGTSYQNAGHKAAGTPRRNNGRKSASKRTRRPAEETRERIAELQALKPDMSQAEMAKLLGISDRQVRNIVNGHRPNDLTTATN